MRIFESKFRTELGLKFCFPVKSGFGIKDTLPSGFHGSSTVKNPLAMRGNLVSIPQLGSSTGKGIGYPLQYSLAFLVAQTVKNLPAMWETWVRSLDWEDPLEEGMAIHSCILAWRISMNRGAWQATVHGVTASQTGLSD